MNISKKARAFAVAALLATVGASGAQGSEPVYSVEGAWQGIVAINGQGATPSLDTFTSNSQKQGVEGVFLCTIPAANKMPNPLNPNGWLATTPSGHGNWARIAKNRYAFTAVRTVFDETGKLFGWARFWGTVTPISENEYTGTMNGMYYTSNGAPMFPQPFTGTMHSNRIEIVLEQ